MTAEYLWKIVGIQTILALVLIPGLAAGQGVLFVEGDNVGIGIAVPDKPLHVAPTTPGLGNLLQIDYDGPARATFNNLGAPSQWSFGHENNDRFAVNRAGSGQQEFAITPNGSIIVGGSVVHSSSRLEKTNFEPVDPTAVLKTLAGVPITKWTYKREGQEVRHMGPVAEDFYEAFTLGSDAKHIALNDSVGVALVAIQGLNEEVRQKSDRIEKLEEMLKRKDNELEQLRERLVALENVIGEVVSVLHR